MNDRPLFVDLDGTLVRTDLLVESLVAAVRNDATILWKLPAWVLGGRAAFKNRLASLGDVDVEALPVREDVVEFLRQQKAAGRTVILATAADRRCADAVAKRVELFDDVLASDGVRNLKREAKLAAIQDYCRQRGVESFAYVGDSSADLPIWAAAAERYAVGPSRAVEAALRRGGDPPHVFPREAASWGVIVRALRPAAWAKNLVALLPIAAAGETALRPWAASLTAVVALCLADSAVQALSDCLNVAADRRRPGQCSNPFARGALPLTDAPKLSLPLAVGAVAIASAVSWRVAALVVAYLAAATLDSLWLRRKPANRWLAAAARYALRVVAGGVAAQTRL